MTLSTFEGALATLDEAGNPGSLTAMTGTATDALASKLPFGLKAIAFTYSPK
jgi:hypothetical protein